MRVEVHLLGPVELCVDGRPVRLPSTTARVLLARLALAAGRVVPVADLVDALWSEEAPANAIGNLHSYVSRLRTHTGPEVVLRDPAGYRLDLPGDAVDVARVDLLAKAARAPAVDPAEAAALLAQALATWRGDALSDVADRLAFGPDVARLGEWRRQLQEEWLRHRLDAGDAAGALPEVEALTRAEPLREVPHLLLMRALHQTGRTAEALAVGRAYRDRVADGHGLDRSPALAELQQRILTGDVALVPTPRRAAPRAVGRGRPGPVDRFVGRQAELSAVQQLLGDSRVMTVVGPGGAGKTRLVREALRGDELVVELADVTSTADVPTAVAGALGARRAPHGGTAAVVERLGSAPAVLVLDNCEHLLAAVRALVDEVVTACPGVRVLATSRQRLGCAGERVLRLGPLPEPDQVELFLDRAGMLRADLDDGPRNRELAREVCRLVDGLPLAVELAARREAVFGLVQLRERLGAGLQVLDPVRGGDRSTAVSATVEWSYRLLDPPAQQLLDRLSVCRGGFGLDALGHFSPDGERLLADLVDASLVMTDHASDPPRYRLLETVRHVCLRHLGEAGAVSARDAHARWVGDLLADLVERQRARDPSGIPRLRREMANIQEALAFLVDSGRREEAGPVAASVAALVAEAPTPSSTEQLWQLAPTQVRTVTDGLLAWAAGYAAVMSSRYEDGDRLLTAALATVPDGHPLQWAARLQRMANAMFTGRVEDVHRDARLLAADGAAPVWAAVRGPCCAALIDHYSGDPRGAARWLEEYRDLTDGPDEDGFVAFTRGELLTEADPEAALRWFATSLERSARSSYTYLQVIAGIGRASVLIRLGRHDEAAAACRELITTVPDAGLTTQLWLVLRLSAELLADLGDPETAATVLDAADRQPSAPVVLAPDVRRHELIRQHARTARPAARTPRPDAPRDAAAVAALVLDALDRLV